MAAGYILICTAWRSFLTHQRLPEQQAIHLAATAALAGIGFEKTKVTLIADPGVTQNVHRLEADGAFGSLRLEIFANPSPDNPKTSHMAALSIMRLLDHEASAIVI